MMDLVKGVLPIRVVIGLLVGAIATYAAVDKAINSKFDRAAEKAEAWRAAHESTTHNGVMSEDDKREIMNEIRENRIASQRLARAVVILLTREGVDLRASGLVE